MPAASQAATEQRSPARHAAGVEAKVKSPIVAPAPANVRSAGVPAIADTCESVIHRVTRTVRCARSVPRRCHSAAPRAPRALGRVKRKSGTSRRDAPEPPDSVQDTCRERAAALAHASAPNGASPTVWPGCCRLFLLFSSGRNAMFVFDSAPMTPVVLRAGGPLLDEAQVAAAAFSPSTAAARWSPTAPICVSTVSGLTPSACRRWGARVPTSNVVSG